MAIKVSTDVVVTPGFSVRTDSISSVSVKLSFLGIVLVVWGSIGALYLIYNFDWLVFIGGFIGTVVLYVISPIFKLIMVADGKKYAVTGRYATIEAARREIERMMSSTFK